MLANVAVVGLNGCYIQRRVENSMEASTRRFNVKSKFRFGQIRGLGASTGGFLWCMVGCNMAVVDSVVGLGLSISSSCC